MMNQLWGTYISTLDLPLRRCNFDKLTLHKTPWNGECMLKFLQFLSTTSVSALLFGVSYFKNGTDCL